MAMAGGEKRFDSDSSDSESFFSSTSQSAGRGPYLQPPPRFPTAPVIGERALRGRPRFIEELPPLPPVPPAEELPAPKRMENPFPARKPVGGMSRSKSIRKTIMQKVEGWWDLGLLEKRQTLMGGGVGARSPVSPRE